MKNKFEEMLSSYGLSQESSILPILDDFPEEKIRRYCWQVLSGYLDLKKEDWIIGLEGGDFIYSFDDQYVFIIDDIWSFNLIAKRTVLELLADKVKALK
uniref:hypothetical protein n=1 Tax=Pedobacter schmidteae TaxID=2201271 RepID=UPI0013CEE102|nr:hypothetical protein [Pedobacter schmidteae]